MKIRSATPELLKLRAPRVDFEQKIHDLSRYMTNDALAEVCRCGISKVRNWRVGSVIPRHDDGQTILNLHAHFCGDKR